jgi:hypothetical protein
MPSGKRSKANRRAAGQTPKPKTSNSSEASFNGCGRPLEMADAAVVTLLHQFNELAFEGEWGHAPVMVAVDDGGNFTTMIFADPEKDWPLFLRQPKSPAGTKAFIVMAEMNLKKGAVDPSLSMEGFMDAGSECRMLTWVDVAGRNIVSMKFPKIDKDFVRINEGLYCEVASSALCVAPIVAEERLAMDFVKVTVHGAMMTGGSYASSVEQNLATFLDDPEPIVSLAMAMRLVCRKSSGPSRVEKDEWKAIQSFRATLPEYHPAELAIELAALCRDESTVVKKFRATFGLAA